LIEWSRRRRRRRRRRRGRRERGRRMANNSEELNSNGLSLSDQESFSATLERTRWKTMERRMPRP
jgi:hypothetical protein